MKRIENIYIPFSNFVALTVWPLLFVRRDMLHKYDAAADNHEHIHAEQQIEMLIVGALLSVVLWLTGCGWWSLLALLLFYWWYLIEFVIKAFYYGDNNVAYRYLAFEREAYNNMYDAEYLKNRKHFAWVKYIGFLPRRN